MKDKTKTDHRRVQLTDKQRRFILEYIKDRNGTQAAIRAGYSRKGADVIASNLLGNIRISSEIDKIVGKHLEDLNLDNQVVLKRVNNIADLDPGRMFDAKGNFLDIPDLPEDVRKCISGFDFVTLYEGDGDQRHAFGQLRKIRFADRLKANELLGKHLKLWTDKVEHGLDEEARRVVAGKLDFSRLDYSQLDEVARALKDFGAGRDMERSVSAEASPLATEPHKDPR